MRAAVVMTLLVAAPVMADTLTPPRVFTVYEPNAPDTRQYRCEPPALVNGRQEMSCRFAQSAILRPKALVESDVQKDQSDAMASIARDAVGYWQRLCALAAQALPQNPTDADRRLSTLIQGACNAKDINLVKQWIRFEAESRAKTCSQYINTAASTYTRIDDDTWQAIDGPTGVCNMTAVIALSRQPGTNLWNVREVRTYATTTGPQCDKHHPTEVFNYGYQARTWSSAQLGCDYIKL